MNKKIKSKALLLALVVALMSFVGCGAKETTSGNNGTDAQTKASTEATTQEASTQVVELSREELLFGDVWLCGKKIDFPCKVKDLPEGCTIGKGYVIKDGDGNLAGIDLSYNGEVIGDILIKNVAVEKPGSYDFSSGYEDYIIYAITDITKMITVRGTGCDSTSGEVVKVFGEPDLRSGVRLYYYHEGEKKQLAFDENLLEPGAYTVSIFYDEVAK